MQKLHAERSYCCSSVQGDLFTPMGKLSSDLFLGWNKVMILLEITMANTRKLISSTSFIATNLIRLNKLGLMTWWCWTFGHGSNLKNNKLFLMFWPYLQKNTSECGWTSSPGSRTSTTWILRNSRTRPMGSHPGDGWSCATRAWLRSLLRCVLVISQDYMESHLSFIFE